MIYLKEGLEEDGYQLFTLKDLSHYPGQILARSFIIAIKYGFYSPEHSYIFDNLVTPKGLLPIDLIAINLTGTNVENIRRRIYFAADQLNIEKSAFKFEFSKE